MEKIKELLELMALHGGKIVCTASLSVRQINQSRASGRLYVDENSLGFSWEPKIMNFPKNEEEVEFFEKWFPLNEPMPKSLLNPDFLFKDRDVYGHCPHGENMTVCSICNKN